MKLSKSETEALVVAALARMGSSDAGVLLDAARMLRAAARRLTELAQEAK